VVLGPKSLYDDSTTITGSRASKRSEQRSRRRDAIGWFRFQILGVRSEVSPLVPDRSALVTLTREFSSNLVDIDPENQPP